MDKKYLICGYGNIGKHILNEFKSIQKEFAIYDKYKVSTTDYMTYFADDRRILDKDYEVAFVCVPTEMKEDGSCDTSEVTWIVNKLRDKAKAIVIRSAIPPIKKKMFGKNVFISPEFYGTTQHCQESPNFCILGGDKSKSDPVVQLYQRVKDGSFKFIFTDFNTAALAKYMENCWIATKVTFCNEFANIGKEFGVNYAALRECWLADPRVSPSHTFVYSDQPYYNSHCLNKDIPAILHFTDKALLMKAVNNINKYHKKNHDCEVAIKGAQRLYDGTNDRI